jgi:hypothetical protein
MTDQSGQRAVRSKLVKPAAIGSFLKESPSARRVATHEFGSFEVIGWREVEIREVHGTVRSLAGALVTFKA